MDCTITDIIYYCWITYNVHIGECTNCCYYWDCGGLVGLLVAVHCDSDGLRLGWDVVVDVEEIESEDIIGGY